MSLMLGSSEVAVGWLSLFNFNVADAAGGSCVAPLSAYQKENLVLMLPWHGGKDALRATIKEITESWRSASIAPATVDLIIHVGIDGVLGRGVAVLVK